VLDRPAYRLRASQMADEFAGIDTRSEILRIISRVVANQRIHVADRHDDGQSGRARRLPAAIRS